MQDVEDEREAKRKPGSNGGGLSGFVKRHSFALG
jgi:hypothetical protein